MNFFSEIPLDKLQAEAIARGLYAVAHADGLHVREEALVAAFWAESGGSSSALSDLGRRDSITGEELCAALPTAELRRLFLKTAILLAFADGQVSGAEHDLVHKYGGELGLSGEVATLEEQVKDFLLSQLSHVQNSEAVAQVAKKLKL